MNTLLLNKLAELKQIARNHKVSTLYAIGSICTDEFNDKSDIDFLVEFSPEYFDGYSENYEDLKASLEDLYKRKIDILSAKAIKNVFLLNSINNSKQLIYD